jgi:non-ribosomal peptide synthase protein (TIGR01720 family)
LRAVPRNGLTYGTARYLKGSSAPPLCELPSLAFNYLGEFGAGSAAFFTLLGEAPGAPIDPALKRPNVLDLVGLVLDRTLRFSFTYSNAQFDEATIARLAEAYRRELLALGAELVAGEPEGRASVQTTFATVSQDELTAFLGRLS